MRNLNLRSMLGTLLLTGITACGFISCATDQTEPVGKAPTITFDKSDGIYVIKAGRTIMIKPTIESDDDAFYSWTTSKGEIIGRESTLSYSSEQSGQLYVTFRVHTDHGSASKEIRIDVAQLVPPTIYLSIPKGGFVTLQGQELSLVPQVDAHEQSTYEWRSNTQIVATTKDYTFKSDEPGTFHLSLTTTNEDGGDFIEFNVEVKSPEQMPFAWLFDQTTYNVSRGRTIRLAPYAITNAFDAQYTWNIDGIEVQSNTNPYYDFEAKAEGSYKVEVTMSNKFSTATQLITVNVCPAEGAYKRESTAGSSIDCNKVYEFLAAPGQFVNEGYTATTMQQACSYAEGRFKQNFHVSLGGFGGYIVVGFDHSIDNDGGYNFQILGNSFKGSSEPGIVYVMQDENGDGVANDTWYELKGSEHGKAETIQNYEITYYRPRSAGMPVSWSDNQGKTGTVDYLAAYHRQDYYYPSWAPSPSYTLRGTRLTSNVREVNAGFWSNDEFEWGYADNFSSIDRLTNDGNNSAGMNANHFKISDAVTFDGKPAKLQYIDFVKVQTGVNAKAGWLGEISTEVSGARDYNIIKKK